MAVTLAEALSRNPHSLSRQLFTNLVLMCEVLKMIPIKYKKGQGYKARYENTTLPGISSRAINSAYTEDAGGNSTSKDFDYKVLGGTADVDTALIQREPDSDNDQALRGLREETLMKKVKALAFKMNDLFINGDSGSVATDPDGLKVLCGAGYGRETALGTNGVNVVADDAAMLNFTQLLDEVISRTPGANAILLNATTKAVLNRIAKKFGYYNSLVGNFGEVVEYYGRCRLIDIGTKADGTEIIPKTETQGSSNAATSMYIVKLDENDGVCLASPQNIESDEFIKDHGEVSGTHIHRHEIDLQLAIVTQDKFAAHRIKGILFA